MKKIFLIIQREYITRVRKKSFIIMSLLGPVLFAAFLVVPAWLATLEDTETKTIAVIDNSYLFSQNLPETEYIKFVYPEKEKFEDLRKNFHNSGFNALLYIPENILASNSSILYSEKESSLSTKMHIVNSLEKEIQNQKLKVINIEDLDKILKSTETKINLRNITWTNDGKQKESNTGLAMGIGYGSGMLIYIFIFMFGAQVMRGVIEEKTSRIVEIIISSVKPFQLMMGKIIGVGLVGLTQFVLWMALTLIFVTAIQKTLFPDLSKASTQTTVVQDIMNSNADNNVTELKINEPEPEILQEIFLALDNVDFLLIIGAFLFYFIGGYLLYASLFAVIGSAVDSEADTQQFMLPVTLPLILAIFVMINTMNNPEGKIAFWFSLFPFTSPVVMMARIPFHPAAWEIILSGFLLVITFLATTWMAGKMYRIGILMYGKKITYRQLAKWLRSKN